MDRVTSGTCRTSFDPNHSPLERDPFALSTYISTLETAIGHGATIVGVLEIGSFANGEGMELSDVDTRVYVQARDYYFMNIAGHVASEKLYERHGALIGEVSKQFGEKPLVGFGFVEFNEPLWDEMQRALGVRVEFGLSDSRITEVELSLLDIQPSREHSFLLQGSILYDPAGFLAKQRARLEGRIFPVMVGFYRKQFLDRIHEPVRELVEFDEADLISLRKHAKVNWIKRAVRALREAVTTKVYSETGQVLHKKEEVLEFYRTRVPEKHEFVSMLYSWKTDPKMRQTLIEACLDDPKGCALKFAALVTEIEDTVSAVNGC